MLNSEQDVSSNSKAEKNLKALVRKVTGVFLVPPEGQKILLAFNENTKDVPSPVKEIADAFHANIVGLLSTVSFPYFLAHSAAVDKIYQRIRMAEGIRDLKIDSEPNESETALEARRADTAKQIADDKMAEFVQSSEGRNDLIGDSLSFLDRSLKNQSLSESANELILQGIVLCWGDFEVLVRDTFVTLLNLRPSLAELLLKDTVAKRRFELAKISLETLATHGFNLSGKMGTILSEQQDLSDLHSIKAVYEALFPNDSKLRSALSETDLRVLSQRRNLVVHRRGLIDETYIKAVNCAQKHGEKIRVAPDELENHIEKASHAASWVLVASANILSSPNATTSG
jgi:hypothetical protein